MQVEATAIIVVLEVLLKRSYLSTIVAFLDNVSNGISSRRIRIMVLLVVRVDFYRKIQAFFSFYERLQRVLKILPGTSDTGNRACSVGIIPLK